MPIIHIRFTNDTYDHFYTGRHLTDGFINRNGDCFCGQGIQDYIPYEHKNKDVNFDFNLPSLPKEINGFYVEAENNNGNINCFFCEEELIDFNGIKVCPECDKKGEKK